jgi:peptide deformylase
VALLNVLRLGHPVLRRRSDEIPPGDIGLDSMQHFIDDLADTMRDYDGVGLAAPQVGEPVRMVVIESHSNPRYPGSPEIPFTVLINPVVSPLTELKVEGWEGCLSVPGLRGMVPRFEEIAVEALDRQGQPLKFTTKGFLSVVIQHETDHLEGIVYLDRMEDFGTLTYLDEFQKYWSEGGGAL